MILNIKKLAENYVSNMSKTYITFCQNSTKKLDIYRSHYCEVLWFDDDKFQYYVKIAELNNLSIRQLREKIKYKEYERLPESAKHKLTTQDEFNVVDYVKIRL